MNKQTNGFLLVSADVLPDYFKKVVETRELCEKDGISVSAACQKTDISRSTYYKYRDKVFVSDEKHIKKSIIWLKMANEKGVLSHILSDMYDFNLNVTAINQTLPVKNFVYLTITIDVSEIRGDIQDLIKRLRQIHDVKSVSLIAFE